MTQTPRTPSTAGAIIRALRAQGWDITDKAVQRALDLDIEPVEILAAALRPERTWPAPKGSATNRWSGQVSVMVPDDEPDFIIGVRRGGPIETPRRTGQPRAKSGGGGRRMPGTARELTDQLRAKGFLVEPTANGHLKITLDTQPDFVEYTASTGSDHRGIANSIARIKRSTGIDITT